jgi:hypothetical protein
MLWDTDSVVFVELDACCAAASVLFGSCSPSKPSPNMKTLGTQIVVAAMAHREVVEVLVERDSTFATTAK